MKGGCMRGPPPPPPPPPISARTAASAASTLSLPPPHVVSHPPAGLSRAVACRCRTMSALVNRAFSSSSKAMAPVTCGAAMLVPVKSPPSGAVLVYKQQQASGQQEQQLPRKLATSSLADVI